MNRTVNNIMKTKYSKEILQNAVDKSKNFGDLFRYFGIQPTSLTRKHFKDKIEFFEIDISHFLKKRGLNNPKISFEDLNSELTSERPKSQLLKRYLSFHNIPEICNCCGLSEWNGNPLTLDIDHIDKNRFNNKIENLQYLCPNCHRQKTLPKKPKEKRVQDQVGRIILKEKECICGKLIGDYSETCRDCYDANKEKDVKWPSPLSLQEEVWKTPLTKIAEMLGCSSNAVKKHCKKRGIVLPPKGFWQKHYSQDFEACERIKEEFLGF